MKLYELNREIETILEDGYTEEAVDKETGEITKESLETALNSLSVTRNQKIENIALYIKNTEALQNEIETEEKKLRKRKEQLRKKADWLKEYLTGNMQILGDTKFESAKVRISFRKSTSTEITNEMILPAEYYDEKVEIKPSLTRIKKAILSGEIVPGAELKEKANIKIE